jgi:hypothetical protein
VGLRVLESYLHGAWYGWLDWGGNARTRLGLGKGRGNQRSEYVWAKESSLEWHVVCAAEIQKGICVRSRKTTLNPTACVYNSLYSSDGPPSSFSLISASRSRSPSPLPPPTCSFPLLLHSPAVTSTSLVAFSLSSFLR